MKHPKPFLCMAVLGVLVFNVAQWAMPDGEENPVIKPIPGFVLDGSEFQDFSSYAFAFEQDGKWTEKKIKGKYWFLYYEYQNGDRTFSQIEIIENHKQAALEKGGKILKEDDAKLDFTVPLPEGCTTWVHLHTWEDSYELYIIEEKTFKKLLEFSAEAMKKELDESGHIAVYGIHFDFDKDNLKTGSEKVLTEIVKLMLHNPALRVEIQGHTDSIGSREYNLKLSEKRAETVKAYLMLYGVAPERMTVLGYGPDVPVASNDTEEGKALNRRVELKKL